MNNKPIAFSIAFLASLVTLPLLAEEKQQPVQVVLHPQDEPRPAFAYRLRPSYMEQTPGNAVVYLGKVTAEETAFFSSTKIRDKYHGWRNHSIEKLRRDKTTMIPLGHIWDDLRRAAYCQSCDWQHPIRTERPLIAMLLPEVQQVREFGRILSAKARTEIALRQYDDAIESLKVGYSTSLHMSKSETLVSNLVAITICGGMNDQVTDLVQQPNAPNLYWALTMLPTPFCDVSSAVDVEAAMIERSFSVLETLDTAKRTPNEWRQEFHRFTGKLLEWISTQESDPAPSPEEIDRLCNERDAFTRTKLIGSGMDQQAVQEMSVHEAAFRYTLLVYPQLHQDGLKYYSIQRYPQAIKGINRAIENAKQKKAEIIPVAENMLSGIRAVKTAIVRVNRQIAVLRIFEALRIHAAHNDGLLPKKLSDITAVPIPNDPVTGKPFEYTRAGSKATLAGPALPRAPLNYEITMAKP